ncbi:MAG: IS21-like element helper ATPase IstB [Pseudomonadota bacterium]|jgi:DNA replication protein DnaC
MINEDLESGLTKLGLNYLKSHLSDFVANGIKQRWSTQQMVEFLVKYELEEHKRRTTERRVTASKVGRFKPLVDFDWSWPRKIDRGAVESLMNMEFIKHQTNVLLFGPSGSGKTMIAKNIAYAAAMSGQTTLATDASDMLTDLEQQESSRLLKLRLARYTKPKLLVIDELGYLSYTTKSADLLFRLITARYQTGSTILTTNVPFKDWSTIFPNASCLTPLIDRLTHRCDIIAIEADSYRQKEASERKTQKSKKSAKESA